MDTPSTHVEAVAANVRRLLRDANIAQRTAADVTGIPITTLVRRLNGRTPFNVNELALIAGLLEVPLDALVKRDAA